MLSDRQIERLPAKIEERFKTLNSDMLQMIGARIKEIGELSPSDAHRLRVMSMINQDVTTITSRLEDITSKSRAELEEIYTRVAKENYAFAETFYNERGLTFAPLGKKTQLIKYVSALTKQTNDELLNMTRTIAFLTNKNGVLTPTELSTAYSDVLDKAVVAVTSGTTDYQAAMRQTMREIADGGLRTKYKPLHGAAGKTVDYASGYSRRLDTAVRQNILWGVKQCNQTVADMTGAEFGADGYEIDYHSNPRPSHSAMGGKQYVIGRARTINGRYFPSFSTVASLLEDYGCLHFKMPIICGVSEPAYTPTQLRELKERDKRMIEFEGKQYTTYEATQVQRKLETAARHAKDRQIIAKAAGDDTLMRQEQEKINQIAHKYKEFSEAAELPTKAERMSVSGYHRVSVKPPKKAVRIVDNSGKSGIIKEQRSTAITKITDRAIEKVPNVKIPGFSKEQCKFIRQQHKELLKYAKEKNDSKEVAFVFNGDLTNRRVFFGEDNMLSFGSELYGKDLLVMHNHPRNSSYSIDDIVEFFGGSNLKSLSIVKNNGNVEVLTKLIGYDKISTIKVLDRMIRKKVKIGSDSEYRAVISKFLDKYVELGVIQWLK